MDGTSVLSGMDETSNQIQEWCLIMFGLERSKIQNVCALNQKSESDNVWSQFLAHPNPILNKLLKT